MQASPTDEEDLEVEEEFGITVVETYTPIDLDSITASSPKRYLAAARMGKFDNIQAGTSRTVQKRAPFKSGKRAGEAQSDVEVDHLWLRAWTPKAFYFCAHFENNRFADATVWDAVGWPRELWVDYSPSASDLKRIKDEPERIWKQRVEALKERARERSFYNNDGTLWTDPNPRSVSAGADFELWLSDIVPGFEPRKKPVTKKNQQAAATAVELIETGEWIG